MATVAQLIDDLVAGKASLEEVAANFARRPWPRPKAPTEAQRYGEADDDPPDPESFDAVNADSRLTPAQYTTLASAAATSIRAGHVLAAGVDTHPGQGNARALHAYWVRGEGLAKWKTWTELYQHLLKYIKDPEEAKRTAAEWFHDRYGFWPGDKKNK